MKFEKERGESFAPPMAIADFRWVTLFRNCGTSKAKRSPSFAVFDFCLKFREDWGEMYELKQRSSL